MFATDENKMLCSQHLPALHYAGVSTMVEYHLIAVIE